MTTLFFKSDTQALMQTGLDAAGLYSMNDDGSRMYQGPVFINGVRYDLDPIGDYYKSGIQVPGYHFNLNADTVPDALSVYQIFPVTPIRIFEGG